MTRHFFSKADMQQGYTVVELLIYIALFVSLSVIAVTFMLSVSNLIVRFEAERTLTYDARLITDSIFSSIQNARSVDMANSTFTLDPSVLALNMTTGSERYQLVNGQVVKDVDGASAGPLNPDTVTVSHLIFYHYATGRSEFVRAHFTASTTVQGVTYAHEYELGAVVRGTYN